MGVGMGVLIKNIGKKSCFLSFEWWKPNFNTFGHL